jgi:menaquinone reductase, iron-sulfur cluster-binding subunit
MSRGGVTRREALAGLAGGAAATVTGLPTSKRPPRYGMVIDLDRCVACGACVVACAVENNVPPLGDTARPNQSPIRWMDLLAAPASPLGARPAPIPCMHCTDPPCTKVCPVGATYRSDDGIVAQIWDRCIGCRACVAACPYSRRQYGLGEPAWPGGRTDAANPDVAVRPAGIVEKCTFCHHRIQTLSERKAALDAPVTDEDLRRLPACAAACPSQAIVFGDLADLQSRIVRLAGSHRASRLLPHLGTGPNVFYLRGGR